LRLESSPMMHTSRLGNSRPVSVLRRADLSDSNAAVPAVRGQPVNSRFRPHFGHSGARDI